MKKTIMLMCCILGILSSCSKEDALFENSNETRAESEKTRWYGVKLAETPSTRGIATRSKLWENAKDGITIKFMDEDKYPSDVEKIKKYAVEWEQYAGIKFNFVEKDEPADVRITFEWNNNDWLVWSYTGTDAMTVTDQNQPTALIGADILNTRYWTPEELRADVLRVFGQILGLEYEQRHQNWTYFDKSPRYLQITWESQFDGIGLEWETIYEYVVAPLSGENAIYPIGNPEIDELSIMAWPYYSRLHTSKLLYNIDLSETDKAFIEQLYPKN